MQDINFVSDLLNSLFIGFGFNKFLTNEASCFDNVELLLWYSYYAYVGYVETDRPWNATVSVARAIATMSPMLRGCYVFSE